MFSAFLACRLWDPLSLRPRENSHLVHTVSLVYTGPDVRADRPACETQTWPSTPCKECATGLTYVQFAATQNMSRPVSQQCSPILYLHKFPVLRFRGCSPSCLRYGSLKGHTLLGEMSGESQRPLPSPASTRPWVSQRKEPAGTTFSLMCFSHASVLLSNGP